MGFSKSVEMPDGSLYTVSKLLANGQSNTKILKSDKAGLGYLTASLSLAPHKASGFNLCPSASKACIADCLYTSGLAGVFPRTIQPARIARSRWLRLDPASFRNRLERELSLAVKNVTRKGFKLAVRLNVLSDVQWEREFPGLLESFPSVQFYDYTKIYKRMARYVMEDFPSNYHLTFSWSGTNRADCLWILGNGGNVAVPFQVKYYGENRKPLPSQFLGYPIIDGDVNDARFLDPQGGYIVGLRAKGKARKDNKSGFVIPVVNGIATEISRETAGVKGGK